MAANLAQKGRNLLIKVSDDTSPGNFTTLGGMRSKTMTINNETVDITDSDCAPWRVLLADAGLRSISLSGSGIFKDEINQDLMRQMAMDGSIRDMQMVFENGDVFQGQFQVASTEFSGEHNAQVDFSTTIESAGEVIFTEGP